MLKLYVKRKIEKEIDREEDEDSNTEFDKNSKYNGETVRIKVFANKYLCLPVVYKLNDKMFIKATDCGPNEIVRVPRPFWIEHNKQDLDIGRVNEEVTRISPKTKPNRVKQEVDIETIKNFNNRVKNYSSEATVHPGAYRGEKFIKE
jgi:hypothetical protein